MNLMLRNGGLPALLSDWLDANLTDVEFPIGKRIGVTVPSANFMETEKEYCVELAAPGLNRKDFKVEMDNRTLTISSEMDDEKKEEREGYIRKEYAYNSFCRSFGLPENIKEDNIDAIYEDGILKIHIPKKEVTSKKSKKEIAVS